MNKTFRKLLVGTAIAGLGAPAMAAMISVGGVKWDPDHPIDFTARSDSMQQTALLQDDGTQLLSGYGKITNINNTNSDVFCPGCELTFEFGDFIYDLNTGSTTADSNGWVRVYVDHNPNYTPHSGNGDPLDPSTANDGVLWLDLAQVADMTVDFGVSGATGRGLLDVVGGKAEHNFDTDTGPNGADFTFQNSFNPGSDGLFTFGSGNYGGSSTVPEPGTLGLLGLGLIGVAAARRRSRDS